MSYFDDASLVMIPSGYKDQKVYSVKPLDGSGDLTFSRASSATRVASNGYIEKVRTNVLTYSNNFSNAAWGTIAIGGTSPVLTSGQADPFGGTSAWRLQCSITSGTGSFIYQNVPTTGSATASIYIKSNTGSSQNVYFRLDDADETSVKTATTQWQRIQISTSAVSQIISIGVRAGATGATSSCDVLIAFAQVETGDIATDYIATTSAAVSVGPVSGLPRLDYLNSSCPRLLLEGQRTNVCLWSENFDNAAWTKGEATISANAATSPDGYSSADKLIPSTNSLDHFVYQIPTVSISTNYTYSCFAKSAGYSYMRIADGDGNNAFFNLSNGTIVGSLASNPKIESFGNGWYKCSITAITSGTTTLFAILPSENGITVNFAGNGTDGILIWGAQLEAGAYATSYIPTLGTSVTRVADAASKTGISSLIGQTEGTIFLEVDFDAAVNTEGYIFRIDESSFNDTVFVSRGDDKILNGVLRVGGSTIVQLQKTAFNGVNKLAFAYKSGSCALYVNGTQAATSAATYTNGITYDDIRIGGFNATTANMCGGIKQLLLFPTRLSNSDLAALTA
jgi:hypothetical protein